MLPNLFNCPYCPYYRTLRIPSEINSNPWWWSIYNYATHIESIRKGRQEERKSRLTCVYCLLCWSFWCMKIVLNVSHITIQYLTPSICYHVLLKVLMKLCLQNLSIATQQHRLSAKNITYACGQGLLMESAGIPSLPSVKSPLLIPFLRFVLIITERVGSTSLSRSLLLRWD